MFDTDFWFKKTEKKFLHNIDSFYFSVKLYNDFSNDSHDSAALHLRDIINNFSSASNKDAQPFHDFLYSEPIIYHPFKRFSSFYSFNLEVPGKFDFFFAPTVPKNQDGLILTSEIHVEIRSKILWEIGPKLAFDEAFHFVQIFCSHYHLNIKEVKENRLDFCWHTNYFDNPEKIFNIDYLSKHSTGYLGRDRKCPGTKKIQSIASFDSDGNVDVGYISLGNRSDKLFLRIYHKDKEVIEQGYKSWFLYQWFFNGLISRYDLYCFEYAYKERNFALINLARLNFIKEYLSDSLSIEDTETLDSLLNMQPRDYCAMGNFADQFLPKVTKIYNIEFQVMRKMSKTFTLIPFRENTGVTKRIYDILDNRKLITNYLTHESFRLIKNDDSNKSRCSYTDFWARLRSCKMIDVPSVRDLKLQREYCSQIDMSIRKKRVVRAISGFALALTRNADSSIFEDAAECMSYINDNDIRDMHEYKKDKLKILPDDIPEVIKWQHVNFFDSDTGVIYGTDSGS